MRTTSIAPSRLRSATTRWHVFARVDRILIARRVFPYSLIPLLGMLITYVAAVVTGDTPFDRWGRLVGEDFSAKDTGGYIALAGDIHRLYDITYQWSVQGPLVGYEPGTSIRMLDPF